MLDARIELSRPQTAINRSRQALTLGMAGQRAGKSQMIGILTGQYISLFPKLKGFIGANTYLQLTQSTLVKVFEIWRDLYKLTEYDSKKNPGGHFVIDKRPPSHFRTYETFKDYNNIISFWNGHIIYVGSLDNYKAHDGKEFCYAHLDETKDTREEAVTSVILARLSQGGLFVDQDGRLQYDPGYSSNMDAIRARGWKAFNPAWIHTSPAIGQVDWLVEMFHLDKLEPEIRTAITGTVKEGKYAGEADYFCKDIGNKRVVIFSTYHNEENLPDGYIENRKSVLSENEQMKFIYGYPFSKTGGEYFPFFERIKHVTKVPYIQGLPTHVSWDFNVLPYITMLACQLQFVDRYIDNHGTKHLEPSPGRKLIQVMQIRVYKEYCLETPRNTVEDVAKEYADDHKSYQNSGIFYYGDSSGRNRIPGLGSLTNFKQVEMYMSRFLHSSSNRVRPSNVNPLQRRDLINKILEGKIPAVELYIDESCDELIRDMEYLKLGEDGKLKERAKDLATGATYEKVGHTSDALEYFLSEILKQYLLTN
jgi:hypothetical protein